MWVLILVFTITNGHGISVATSEIPGFTSRLNCVQAGASVENIKRYACVEVK